MSFDFKILMPGLITIKSTNPRFLIKSFFLILLYTLKLSSHILIFLIFFLITSEAHAKKWKAFLCNYKDGVLENASDPCEKEANKFKIYLHKYSFKSEKLCDEWILEASSTPEAKEAYPVDIWIIGCDKNW